jgi:hypothetical protein
VEAIMSEIIIQAQNPLDLKEEDLRDYVAEVRKNLPQIEVYFDEGEKMPAGARSVTWWEVVRVYLSDVPDEIKGFVIGKLLELSYDWAKQRFQKAKQNKRPKCVVIHDNDRQERGSMVLTSAKDEPVTVEEAMKPMPAKRARKGSASTPL